MNLTSVSVADPARPRRKPRQRARSHWPAAVLYLSPQPPDLRRLLDAHPRPRAGVDLVVADPLRGVSAVAMPSLAAIERIAAYSIAYSPQCSITRRTAHSRSSLGTASA